MSTISLPETASRPVVLSDGDGQHFNETPVVPNHRVESKETQRPLRNDLYLDLFERFLVIGLFSWLAVRFVTDYVNTGNMASLFLLASEGLVVIFMIVRRTSREMSRRPREWLIALGATCAPMLVAPVRDAALVPVFLGSSLMLIGLFVQLHAKLTLGRSIGLVPAHRGLRLRGPYRFVRHPMYAGYAISHLAFLLVHPSLWNLCVILLCYSMQIPRILIEERMLSVDPDYRDYQAQVRFRLIPGIF